MWLTLLYTRPILFTFIILSHHQGQAHLQCHLHLQITSKTVLGPFLFFSSARTYMHQILQESVRLWPKQQEKPELLCAFRVYQKSWKLQSRNTISFVDIKYNKDYHAKEHQSSLIYQKIYDIKLT